uniref:Uncharacterized protein n=1 Tax=Anguilla anguilla TaxID=7936 RepID=A0A0E9UIB0_ANGAN
MNTFSLCMYAFGESSSGCTVSAAVGIRQENDCPALTKCNFFFSVVV